MPDIVLVHGAWHGGWCWQRVAEQLRSQGHRVFAPSLTGLGDRSHLLGPDVDLSTHVLDVANLIDSYDLDDVILCGHSYGGMVITGVADRMSERIQALVYLDALVPEDGQCMFDTIPTEIADGFRAQAAEGDGYSVPPMTGEQFNVNAADADWMNAKCTNHPLASFTEPLRFSGAHGRGARCVYVLAAGFEHPGTRGAYEKVQGQPGWEAVVMDGGHDLMLDNPAAVTALLAMQV
ncbi:MAG: alpha/beta fold hydrolase [Pseudomonadales bacterium]|nr:alpha/beta hydrolase [Pseudomonadales bacterium]NIX07268.1 alpha/beta fold hydrolase [Pseudomonadales bacterium]